MIYISTGCIPGATIKERVEILAKNDFSNIELTGGTAFYENYLDDLLHLKNKYQLNYLVHNYFPPPEQSFVLNLGSLQENIENQSVSLCKNAIQDAAILGSDYYSFHAGFYFDPDVSELGTILDKKILSDINVSQSIFKKNFEYLKEVSDKNNIKLYIENNVINLGSFLSFNRTAPAMLLNSNDYKILKQDINFNLLLDVAHLKVSANSMKLDFSKELSTLLESSDYLHLSDNNGLNDENKAIKKNSNLFDLLKIVNINNKTITLEIYDDLDTIKESYELISSLKK